MTLSILYTAISDDTTIMFANVNGAAELPSPIPIPHTSVCFVDAIPNLLYSFSLRVPKGLTANAVLVSLFAQKLLPRNIRAEEASLGHKVSQPEFSDGTVSFLTKIPMCVHLEKRITRTHLSGSWQAAKRSAKADYDASKLCPSTTADAKRKWVPALESR